MFNVVSNDLNGGLSRLCHEDGEKVDHYNSVGLVLSPANQPEYIVRNVACMGIHRSCRGVRPDDWSFGDFEGVLGCRV